MPIIKIWGLDEFPKDMLHTLDGHIKIAVSTNKGMDLSYDEAVAHRTD